MTQMYGIIAHPVAHSLSPAMHNAAFESLGIDATFEAFDVTEDQLAEFMQTRTDIEGMAVSLPHKQTVGAHLEGMDPIAKQIGAVNTVYQKEGKRWGTNTDAYGFEKALREVMPDLKGKRVVVIGAGGAARAVLSALVLDKPEFITIVNRSIPKGVELAKQFGCRFGGKIEDILTETPDLLVNATSVGIKSQDDAIELVPEGFVAKNVVVFDLVYRKQGETRLIQYAKSQGATVIDGKPMLLHQGMRQFELWTGEKAPRSVMEQALN